MIRIIVCTDENGLFAYNGLSLKPPPGDLKRFKQLTQNHVVVMGRITWESLPVKPLPDRINFVISSNEIDCSDDDFYQASDVNEAIEYSLNEWPDKHIYIIGGQHIYNEALPLADQIAKTVIHGKVPDDCINREPRYFHIPGEGWKLITVENYDNYDFEIYEKC